LQELGLALGGEAGARQSQRQAMPTSPDTLLRLTRTISIPERATPRVLAVDDFAFRKGRTYGTILIDGEEHHPVDLLPERSAAALATWLQEHPGVEIITRDRAPEYAGGASDGAPQALQVLDRWHLIGNLQEALARLLDRLRSRLQALLTTPSDENRSGSAPVPRSIYDRELRRGTKDQVAQQQSRTRRYAVYGEVKALHRQGLKILQIARKLEISRQTVRRYIASDQFPEISQKPRQASMLDPYVASLQERWDAGCRTTTQLYRELQALGYGGSIRPLVQWTLLRREEQSESPQQPGRKPARQVELFVGAETAPKVPEGRPKLPGSQSLAWLLLEEQTSLTEAKQRLVEQLKQDADLTMACSLAQQFLTMVRKQRPEELGHWLEAVLASGLGELDKVPGYFTVFAIQFMKRLCKALEYDLVLPRL